MTQSIFFIKDMIMVCFIKFESLILTYVSLRIRFTIESIIDRHGFKGSRVDVLYLDSQSTESNFNT